MDVGGSGLRLQWSYAGEPGPVVSAPGARIGSAGIDVAALAADAARLLAEGGVVSGSSAGAMVLSGWTVLPDRPGPAIERGLGVVPDVLVLPHWTGDGRADWLRAVEAAVPDGVEVLGIPEQSGVLVDGPSFTAVGSAATSLLRSGGRVELGATWQVTA